jgi:hypothetical protein
MVVMRNHGAVPPNFGSKSSEARVARLVRPQAAPAAPLASACLRPLLAVFAVVAANYQPATSCPPRKSWASEDGSDEKQPGNPVLCRSFLAVRAETDISLAKYARLPKVALLNKNPLDEILLPFEFLITVAFCQYDNTIYYSVPPSSPPPSWADRVRGGDRLAKLGAPIVGSYGGCIDQMAPNRQFGCGAIAPASVAPVLSGRAAFHGLS